MSAGKREVIMSAKRRLISQFHIAFDTNALYTEAENKLINDALSKFIIDKTKIEQPKVAWYLLEIVRAERYHQMLLVGEKFLSQVDRIEKLLGKKYGITADDVKKSIDEVIDKEAQQYGLQLRKLDTKKVDWPSLIDRATSRTAPFEEGPKEKGFRDSIVLETFLQMVDALSKDHSQKFVLITKDKRLKDALDDRAKTAKHIITVADLQALESMLNAYVSQIDEAEIDEILQNAQLLFFEEGAGRSLLSEWKIESKIRDQNLYSGYLYELPSGRGSETTVTAKISSVGPTTFVEEAHGDFTFVTRLTFSRAAATPTSDYLQFRAGPFKSNTSPYGVGTATINLSDFGRGPKGAGYQLPVALANTSLGYGSSGAVGFNNPLNLTLGTGSLAGENLLFPSAGGLVSGAAREDWPSFIYTFGQAIFEIRWKATVTSERKLANAKLMAIQFYSSSWTM
jgi:hypothetical protein